MGIDRIGLQLCNGAIKLFPKGDAIGLVQQCLVKPLHAIGLRAFGFRAGIIDVFDGEIELVVIVLGVAARVLSRASLMAGRCELMPLAYGFRPGRVCFRSFYRPLSL